MAGKSASGIKAGRAFVLIDAVDATGTVLDSVKRRFMAMGHELTNIGRGLFTKSVAALLPIGLGMKVFTDFDDAMRKVAARSQGTGVELKRLRQQAIDLGRATAFTAADVANLQAVLAQKGFKRGEILGMTPNILNLARAGGEGKDLGTDMIMSAELVSGTLRAFQKDASESGDVADAMAVAINNSNYKLEDLIVSLQYAGPAAKAFNVSMDETLATMAALRDLNIDASIVGTAFRNMMTYMSKAKDRDRFNQQLEEMTGKTIEFVDAQGNLHKLPQILHSMGSAMKGLGTSQIGDMMHDLFGTRAEIPAIALAESADRFDEIMSFLLQKKGEAKRAHDEMERGIGGAWREFQSVVEDVGLALGEALDKPLTRVLTTFQAWGRELSRFMRENKGLVTTIVATIAAMGVLGAAIFTLGAAFLFITPILTFFKTITWLLSIGLWALFSAAMAVWPAMVAFSLAVWNGTGALLAFTVTVYNAIVAVFAFAVELMSAATAAFAALAAALGGWLPAAVAVAFVLFLLAGAAIAVADGFDEVLATIIGTAKGIGGGFKAMIDRSKILLEQFGAWLYGHAVEMGDTLSLTYRGFVAGIQSGKLEQAWLAATLGLKIIWLQLLDAMMEAWERFPRAFLMVWWQMGRALEDMMRAIQTEVYLSLLPKEQADIIREATGQKSAGDIFRDWVTGAYMGTEADKARNKEIGDYKLQLADIVKALEEEVALENAKREEDRKLADDLYKSQRDSLVRAGGAAIQVTPVNEALFKGTWEAIRAISENFKNADNETLQVERQQAEYLKSIKEFTSQIKDVHQELIEIKNKEGV